MSGGVIQGPRSNSEIGGAPLVTQYRGCTKHFFLLILYNFKNIGEGGGARAPPPAPLLRGPCIMLSKSHLASSREHEGTERESEGVGCDMS